VDDMKEHREVGV